MSELNTNITLDNQLKWELLNHEIRKSTVSYEDILCSIKNES